MIIVIGAGQAGLAAGRELRLAGHDVLLVEAHARVGESWRRRWDSLRLFTPARFSSLPGLPLPGDGGRHPGKDEVADYLRAYAAHFELPVQLGTAVSRLRRAKDGTFEVVTDGGVLTADGVVVATGPFHRPRIPDLPLAPEIVTLHSAEYRNPDRLPDGPVLVVGGGNSGMQIAAELSGSRPVTLALGGRQPVLPQRVLGLDLFTWLRMLGIVRVPAGSRVGRLVRRRDPLIGIGPGALRRLGVRVVDRVTAAGGDGLRTAGGHTVTPSVVIWATGYRPDYGWLRVPGALAGGVPLHAGGIGPVPGLTYVGLPFQRSRGSALLGWVGHDAAVVARSYPGRRT
ncbi:pyridine nucleotide-disulfide oxidoreductase [Nonomuraea sp. MG754425]|uniref:flavin-containing monooxygenase n=1 Tax=Nonomuraea sp. MG754425 TaxID=2570319 RepID=UPI001F1588F0|nr:NAD(P)-binding domain-containing protein [Nonomuraea sp. MG754425]MCF6468312.1 pyridine nucleotide-disulfide oxidoreductase [Nonomuraea sp. MG754425]